MAKIKIPRVNWHIALAEAIRTAQPGDTILVHSEAMKGLAQSAMKRMNRTDLHLEIEGEEINEDALFGMLVGSTPFGRVLFPPADAEDLANGARFIPGDVTDARRKGQTVTFIQEGDTDWYWIMPDGSRISHD